MKKLYLSLICLDIILFFGCLISLVKENSGATSEIFLFLIVICSLLSATIYLISYIKFKKSKKSK